MQHEIQRIKNKDYSYLDDRLFESFTGGRQVDHTINQLVELQNYLRAQIDNIQNEEEKEAMMRMSSVALGTGSHFFTPEPQRGQQKEKLVGIHAQITKARKMFRDVKSFMQKQYEDGLEDAKKVAQEAVERLWLRHAKKATENSRLKQKVLEFQLENESLKEENRTLKFSLQKLRRRVPVEKITEPPYHQTSEFHSEPNAQDQNHNHKHSVSLQNFEDISPVSNINMACSTPRVHTLLRNSSSLKNSKQVSQQSLSKAVSHCQQLQAKIMGYPPNQYSRSYQSAGKQTHHQNSGREKQNLLLKKKGAEQAKNRRTVKKLKVFSHF